MNEQVINEEMEAMSVVAVGVNGRYDKLQKRGMPTRDHEGVVVAPDLVGRGKKYVALIFNRLGIPQEVGHIWYLPNLSASEGGV